MEMILDEELPKSRLAFLLKHFSQIEDGRQSSRVAFPLAEMLLLLTSQQSQIATILMKSLHGAVATVSPNRLRFF
jgi:hypothetical protein